MRALVLALLLAACGAEEEAPRPALEGESPEGAPEPDDDLRAPLGRAEIDCTQPPDDPDRVDLFAAAAANDLPAAIRGLEALAGEHPASGSARVRLGELLLRAQPPEAARASRWFDRAMALHEMGCQLGYRDHWAALEGQGLSRMMQGRYDSAVAPLERSIDAWPGVRSTHYNLACALCQTGDIDGCARELETVLGDLDAPDFGGDQARPPGYYREMIARDPDLAPIRNDPERMRALLGPR